MGNSKIILGTVQLGLDYGVNNKSGKPDLKEAFEILSSAYKNGVRILDTAEAYGSSQEVIGSFHTKNPETKFNVISKVSKSGNLGNFKDNVLKSLKVLEIDSFYGYMVHNYQTLKENPSIYTEMLNIKNDGFAKLIGISLYENEEIRDVIDNYRFDFIQIPFNILDNHSFRGEIIEKARKSGLEIHTRSSFLQGLFFMDIMELPKPMNPLKKDLERIKGICAKHNMEVQDLSLGYVNSKSYIDQIVIGVDSNRQLLSNLKSAENVLSEEIIMEIEEIKVENKKMLNPTNW
jgi:aryl-alcohol dehydrogenase-like predicted oxidoreductase